MFAVKPTFDGYQEIRQRIPATSNPRKTSDINLLLDVADDIDAFVFDAFGVLNVGETYIRYSQVNCENSQKTLKIEVPGTTPICSPWIETRNISIPISTHRHRLVSASIS